MTRNPQQEEAAGTLLRWLKPGSSVWTVLRHVSPSGMTRWLDLYVIDSDGEPIRLTYQTCLLTGYRYDTNREALKIQGCGMDMGFQAVYNLGEALWPAGTSEPHGTRNGEPDSTGGYALRQRWL